MPDLAASRVILDTALDAVIVMDGTGLIADWNARAEALFGWAREEVVGRPLAGIIVPERYRAAHEQGLARFISGGDSAVIGQLLELSALNRAGEEFPVELSIALLGADGAPTFLGFVRDISHRRRAVATLAASEDRLRLASEAAQLGVWDWDLQTNAMTYSPVAKEIFGFPLEAPVTFDQVRDATHPEDYPRTWPMARRAIDPEVRAREPYEYRVIRPDGEIRWVLAHGEALFEERDGLDHAVRYVGTIQDITERKLTDQALRSSEARLRLALDAGRMAVWEYDVPTNAVTTSPELNRIFGHPDEYRPTVEEMAGHYCVGEQERVQAAGAAALARQQSHFEVEYRGRRLDGAVRWLLLRAEVRFGMDGAPSGALGVLIDITDRKEAEGARAASDQRLRALADHLPKVMIYQVVVDPAGQRRFTYVSNSCESMNGLSSEAVLADAAALYSLIDPEHLPALAAAEAAALEARAPFHCEVKMRSPDEEMRWVRLSSAPISSDDGSTIWNGIQLDIHESKIAEQQLRASEARFRAAIDAVQGVLWTNTASGEMSGEQPGWAALTGQAREDYEGYGWTDAVHPEDKAATLKAWTEAVTGRRTFVFEHRIRCADSVWRTFSVRAIPTFDAQGELREWVGVHTDITEERAAQQRLEDLNENLGLRVEERTRERDRLWELSEDLLVVADYDGGLLRVSPSWTRLLGRSEEALLQTPYGNLIHSEDRQLVAEALQNMRKSGRPVSFECRLQTLDGGWIWIAFTLSPEPGGRRLNGVGRDVSTVKEQQAELAAAQEALRQSQKLEAMGQLTGGVAHDFNNLLTPIIGSLDMLARRGVGGEREQKLIDAALQSADRAKLLVQRLLAFARRQPLQPQALDMKRLISGMADLMTSTLGPGIKIEVDTEQAPPAMADENQLEMAILNLCVNARDAMPQGGVLTISARPEIVSGRNALGLSRGDYVKLSVQDTGAGMDEEVLARAIEPFFSTKGIGKGTGLGLSMVHGLASQLGGALDIASVPGRGTAVRLWLPASAEPKRRALIEDDSQQAGPTVGRALLVDDEDVVRLSTAYMLAELGYEVVEAENAQEALRQLDSGYNFELLVTDHVMPGMTGLELARTVKTTYPHVATLIVSGFADNDRQPLEFPRLSKPFVQADLAAKLRQIDKRFTETS